MGKAEVAGSGTSPASPCVLPDAWIEKIFQRLHGLYGSLWLDRYRIGQSDAQGRDLGVENAKATWSCELAGFAECPEAIGWALKQLSSIPFPPTLPEFLALCRQAPRPAAPALPEPKCDAETARRHLAVMNEVIRGKIGDC